MEETKIEKAKQDCECVCVSVCSHIACGKHSTWHWCEKLVDRWRRPTAFIYSIKWNIWFFPSLSVNWHQKHRLVKILLYIMNFGPIDSLFRPVSKSMCIDRCGNRYNLMIFRLWCAPFSSGINGVSISHNKICQLCRCYFYCLNRPLKTQHTVFNRYFLRAYFCRSHHFISILCFVFSLFPSLSVSRSLSDW